METLASQVTVLIGDKNLETQLEGMISRIEVDLQMNEESSAVIEIEEVYDFKKQSLQSKLSNGVKPGSLVEIQMGYEGKLSKVFSGYVERIELTAGEEQTYSLCLYAYDAIYLMKKNSYCRMITQKSHSAVIEALMKPYKWLGIKTSCDKTTEYKAARNWYQNETDYEFLIRELLERCPNDREFYISLGTAYYKEPDSSKILMTIEPDSGILNLKAESSFLNRCIHVYGSSSTFQAFTGSSDSRAKYIKDGAEKGEEILMISDGFSQEFVDGVAKSRGKKLKRKSVSLELELEGNPELLSSGYVKIQKLDNIWNGTYRIRRAVHHHGENGYQTHITLEGC